MPQKGAKNTTHKTRKREKKGKKKYEQAQREQSTTIELF
jgi:hypothetical protein